MNVDNQILSYIDEHKKFKDILHELRRIAKGQGFEETLKCLKVSFINPKAK